MLSKEENELLTRTGADTPMGQLMRRYWLPMLFSSELEQGGKPKRVRLLGEALVAFRLPGGTPTLLGEYCSHRRVSLYFGRNEEGGVRCAYHGWKYGAGGRCLDMPSEPPESSFKDKVQHPAYPCAERGGVIWTYMGPAATPPPLPDLEWAMLPANQVFISKRYQACNYMQAMEGGIDSAHISFLHAPLSTADAETLAEIDRGGFGVGLAAQTGDTAPRFEVLDTDYGVIIGARRNAPDDQYYWRVTQFLMPFYTMPPTPIDDPIIQAHIWVPMSDAEVINWTLTWHPRRPLSGEELAAQTGGAGSHVIDYAPATSEAYGDIHPRASRANDYLMDWEAHRTRLYCGIPGFGMQDQGLQESAGSLVDRSLERLGTSDTAIIRVRRRLMAAARALHERDELPPALDPRVYGVRPTSVILPRDLNWVDAAMERMMVQPGRTFSYV